MAITVAMRTEISQLYVALFGRAPDGDGLGFWVGLRDQGQSLAQIANTMYQTTPARTYFPSFLTNTEIISAFYTNVLGRAADADGLAFWTGKLNAAGATPGSVIAEMINVVANYAGTDAAGKDSQALFNNKVTVAQYYGEKNGNVAGAQTVLTSVTKDAASVTTAKTTIDSGTIGGINQGTAFTLTTSVDNLTGTNGNDSFTAVISATAGESTLSLADQINGGSGTDALNLTVSGNVSLPAASITNVENFFIKNLAGAATAHDFSGVSGEAQVWSSGSTVAAAFTGLDKAAIGVQNTAQNVTATFKDTAFVSGGTLDIAVDGAGTSSAARSTITIGQATNAASAATAVTINASGKNFVTLAAGGNAIAGANGIKTVTVTGTGTLDLDATSALVGTTLAADVTKLDASANTGGVTATVGKTTVVVAGGAGGDKITVAAALTTGAKIELGAGNDQLLVNGGSVDANVVIDGGDGTDTVSNGLITVANGAIFKNFEKLALDAAVTTDVELLTGSTISALAINGNAAATVQNVKSASTVDVTSTTAASTVTIGVKGAAASTTDSLTFNFTGSAQAVTPSAANIKAGTVVAAEVESLAITSGGADNTWNSGAFTANKLKTMTITGAKNLDLTFAGVTGTNPTAAGGAVSSIDASALTGKLAINLANVVFDSAAAGFTLKGGTGNDTITLSNQATGATITGGGGNDKYVVTAAVATTADATTATITTITDFNAGDSIALGTLTAITNTQTSIAAATNLTNALDLALKNAAVTQNTAARFQYGGNTYVAIEVDATDGFSAGDVVIKLAGLIDLTNTAVASNTLTLS